MPTKPMTLPRRAVLRGVGGAALALPALEIIRARGTSAAAMGRVPRFVVCYCGTSISACYRGGAQAGGFDHVTPMTTGPGYEMTTGLKPIFDAGVTGDMGLVSGLKIRCLGVQGPHNEPGGISVGFHSNSLKPQLMGTKITAESTKVTSPTCDQLMASIIAADTAFNVLPLRVEDFYQYSSAEPISYTRSDPTKSFHGVNPYFSLEETYSALFGKALFVGRGADPTDALKRRTSVIDAVKRRTDVLMRRLGQQDRTQMDQYLTFVRAMETRIQKLGSASALACKKPDPVKDPPRGHYYDLNTTRQEIYDETAGYSNETERGRAQKDLIQAALACDLTRVVSWHITGSQCKLNLFPIFGEKREMHAATHDGGGDGLTMARSVAWHVDFLAQLVKGLGEMLDFDGSRMIDNTILLMVFEGGWGRSSNSEEGESNFSPGVKDDYYLTGGRYAHSHENMVCVMAGGKNFGLKAGQHIHCNNDYHPAEAILTAMRKLGHTGNLGDMSRTLPLM